MLLSLPAKYHIGEGDMVAFSRRCGLHRLVPKNPKFLGQWQTARFVA
jgi:hypothetical protein